MKVILFYAPGSLVSILIISQVCYQHGLKCSGSDSNDICPSYQVVVIDTHYFWAGHKLKA